MSFLLTSEFEALDGEDLAGGDANLISWTAEPECFGSGK